MARYVDEQRRRQALGWRSPVRDERTGELSWRTSTPDPEKQRRGMPKTRDWQSRSAKKKQPKIANGRRGDLDQRGVSPPAQSIFAFDAWSCSDRWLVLTGDGRRRGRRRAVAAV